MLSPLFLTGKHTLDNISITKARRPNSIDNAECELEPWPDHHQRLPCCKAIVDRRFTVLACAQPNRRMDRSFVVARVGSTSSLGTIRVAACETIHCQTCAKRPTNQRSQGPQQASHHVLYIYADTYRELKELNEEHGGEIMRVRVLPFQL